MFQMVQDEKLLKDCNTQVIIEKSSTAKVLEYLIEIDNRKLWIKEGYASMYDFCIRYLGYSEREANRRIQAARLSQRIEVVKPLLEKGEISLTEEIKALLEEARKLASEKNNTLLLKKVLKALVKPKPIKRLEPLYMARLYFPKARRFEGEGKGYRKEAGTYISRLGGGFLPLSW
jgi:hypothetical protein